MLSFFRSFCLNSSTFLKKNYLWLCWVFVSVRGLSLVAASGDHSSSRCAGLSLSLPLLLWSTGSRHTGSVVVAHGPCCSAAYGIFPDQGSNPCPLHRQADSQPLRHQGSPNQIFFCLFLVLFFFFLIKIRLFYSMAESIFWEILKYHFRHLFCVTLYALSLTSLCSSCCRCDQISD